MLSDVFFSPYLAIAPESLPDMSIATSKKDEQYDLRCQRAFLGSVSVLRLNDFRLNYATNCSFFRGDQWTNEDKDTFLKDGGVANKRIALKRDIIQPMVNRLKGAARGMSVSAKAETMTQRAKGRREDRLTELMTATTIAGRSPWTNAVMKQQYPIGDTQQETFAKFENSYQDKFIRGTNSIMSVMADHNRFDYHKEDYAEDMALSGIIASIAYIHGDGIWWDRIMPSEIIFDTTSIYSDFSDSTHWSVCPLMDVSTIVERYNPKSDIVELLNKAMASSTLNTTNGFIDGRPRVFTTYWKDMHVVEKGWVLDPDGLPHYCIINKDFAQPGEKIYTNADLITPPDDELNRRVFKGNKKVRCRIQVIRSCTMIPQEYAPGLPQRPLTPESVTKMSGDIILDHGLYPLQEENPLNSAIVGSPIKFTAWSLIDGYVIAPVTEAIMPQRFINRVQSNIDWQLSKSGGKSAVIGARSIDPTVMNEARIQRALKESDPIIIDETLAGGINQAIGIIDTSPSAGIYNQFSLIQQAVADANTSTGINDPSMGRMTSGEQAVGVTQMLLQQTSIITAPFFGGIADHYGQLHQFDAQTGRQFYCKHPQKLIEMVGEEDARALMTMPDAALERIRVRIKMDVDHTAQIKQGDELLMFLLTNKLIDPANAAEVGGRSYPEEVWEAFRKSTRDQAEAAKAQAAAQQQAQAMEQIALKRADLGRQQEQVYKDMKDELSKDQDRETKLKLPAASNQAKQMFPDPTEVAQLDIEREQMAAPQ